MNIIVASTSTIYGGKYLDYLKPDIQELFKGITEIVFIPFARPSGLTHDAYTQIARDFFLQLNINIKGLHEFENKKHALQNAGGVFTGGGNTFVLVNEMYKQNLWNILRNKIQNGMPYLGTSAGSNITGKTMHNTNDMPIVTVPSYQTLGILPFNINPHYLDPAPKLLKHMGETRDTRIKEYLHFNTTPVVALREGSWLRYQENKIFLYGKDTARIYFSLDNIQEIESGNDISNLFQSKVN